jgi:DNA-binding LacI/PurR family transcriptional regulator
VPQDLSIVGIDGHELGEFFQLTTVDQFPMAQGERAAQAILKQLEGGADASGGELPFELIVRGTTARA